MRFVFFVYSSARNAIGKWEKFEVEVKKINACELSEYSFRKIIHGTR